MALKSAQETSLRHIWGRKTLFHFISFKWEVIYTAIIFTIDDFPIQFSIYTCCRIHHVFCTWGARERNWYLDYKMAAWLHSTTRRNVASLSKLGPFLTGKRVKVSVVHLILCFLMIRDDPSRSDLIRVDPTRTGGPSWSGPTFVPASSSPYVNVSTHYYPIVSIHISNRFYTKLNYKSIRYIAHLSSFGFKKTLLLFRVDNKPMRH